MAASSTKSTVRGGRINTIQVVEKAIELRAKAIKNGHPYDAVWAVFDKDDFPAASFNAAISKAERNGIGCAWSNEAFELWYVFHFANRVTPMSRNEYSKAIGDYISSSPKFRGKYTYKKNDSQTHLLLTTHGDEAQAIRYAEKQEESYGDNRYAQHNPSTTVYKLVRLLRGEDTDFNSKLIADL